MSLSADSPNPGYAFYPVRARKLVAKWRHSGDPISNAPTISICTGKDGAVNNLLHGELYLDAMVLRLMRAGYDFRYPHWHLQRAPHTLANLTDYELELHVDPANPGWTRLVHRLAGGGIVNQHVGYDPDLADFLGDYVFAEPWNTRLLYDEFVAWEEPDTYAWPTLNVIKNAKYNNAADGWVQAPFGSGTVTPVAGAVRIAASAYPGGGGLTFTGSFVTGDKIRVSADIINLDNMDVAFVNGGGAVSNIEIVANNIVSPDTPPVTVGRMQVTMTFNQNVTDPILVFLASGVPGGTPGTMDLQSLFCVKNPPTSV